MEKVTKPADSSGLRILIAVSSLFLGQSPMTEEPEIWTSMRLDVFLKDVISQVEVASSLQNLLDTVVCVIAGGDWMMTVPCVSGVHLLNHK